MLARIEACSGACSSVEFYWFVALQHASVTRRDAPQQQARMRHILNGSSFSVCGIRGSYQGAPSYRQCQVAIGDAACSLLSLSLLFNVASSQPRHVTLCFLTAVAGLVPQPRCTMCRTAKPESPSQFSLTRLHISLYCPTSSARLVLICVCASLTHPSTTSPHRIYTGCHEPAPVPPLLLSI